MKRVSKKSVSKSLRTMPENIRMYFYGAAEKIREKMTESEYHPSQLKIRDLIYIIEYVQDNEGYQDLFFHTMEKLAKEAHDTNFSIKAVPLLAELAPDPIER